MPRLGVQQRNPEREVHGPSVHCSTAKSRDTEAARMCSRRGGIKEVRGIYTMEKKRVKWCQPAEARMDPEPATPSEVSQAEKGRHHMILFICGD